MSLYGQAIPPTFEVPLKESVSVGRDAPNAPQPPQNRKRLVEEILESINTAVKNNPPENSIPSLECSIISTNKLRAATSSPIDEHPEVPQLVTVQQTLCGKPVDIEGGASLYRHGRFSPTKTSQESMDSQRSRNQDLLNTLVTHTTNEAREIEYVKVRAKNKVYEEISASRYRRELGDVKENQVSGQKIGLGKNQSLLQKLLTQVQNQQARRKKVPSMDKVLITKQLRPENKGASLQQDYSPPTVKAVKVHKKEHLNIDLPKLTEQLRSTSPIKVERYRKSLFKPPSYNIEKTIYMPGQVFDDSFNTRNSMDKSILPKDTPTFRTPKQAKRFFKSTLSSSIDNRTVLEQQSRRNSPAAADMIVQKKPQHHWVEQHLRAQHSLPSTPPDLPAVAKVKDLEKGGVASSALGTDLLNFYKKELVDTNSFLAQNLDKEKDKFTRMFYNFLAAAKNKNHTLKKLQSSLRKNEESRATRDNTGGLRRQTSSQTCLNEEMLGSKYA